MPSSSRTIFCCVVRLGEETEDGTLESHMGYRFREVPLAVVNSCVIHVAGEARKFALAVHCTPKKAGPNPRAIYKKRGTPLLFYTRRESERGSFVFLRLKHSLSPSGACCGRTGHSRYQGARDAYSFSSWCIPSHELAASSAIRDYAGHSSLNARRSALFYS